MLFIFQVALEFKEYDTFKKKFKISYSALTPVGNSRAVASLAETQAYEAMVIGAGWCCSYRGHTSLMPSCDFATVHPPLIQTSQGSSGYLSLFDITFVCASHAGGEGLTSPHVRLRYFWSPVGGK